VHQPSWQFQLVAKTSSGFDHSVSPIWWQAELKSTKKNPKHRQIRDSTKKHTMTMNGQAFSHSRHSNP
jgi:hypothetical protein